ncbi:MAG: hypothetical protein NTW17_01140 [Candidatus Pacearchaeota archaeon]|nr:hypothetical protein [Candidatus Pacearchaeota archaeon]
MGLFSKKEKKSEEGIPELPRLPRLPDFPEMEDEDIPLLPRFPSSPLGRKFSQHSIKDAVSGEKEDKDFYADEFPGSGMRMTQEPLRKSMTEEVEEEIDEEFPEKSSPMIKTFRQESEPVFIRIDKFEEGLRTFEAIKSQISEIEKILAETKRIKEKEDIELRSWENELKRMKGEIEKISRDIFSKI